MTSRPTDSQRPSSQPKSKRARVCVLVVDDSPSNRELLRQELADEGFDVLLAVSGREALRVAKRGSIDVILLDINMPSMDGIETCQKLRQDPATASIPVIFLTASPPDADLRTRALAAGGNDFISKPYSAPLLVARISAHGTVSRFQRK